MNREQQKVLELLKEIDIICRKNKITYFLSPYLTLCAVTERPFPLNPEAGVIYMKTGDMERFKNVFEEEPVLRNPWTVINISPDFIFGIQIKTHCFTRWMITENFSIPVWQ